jgi:hypothetical protein
LEFSIRWGFGGECFFDGSFQIFDGCGLGKAGYDRFVFEHDLASVWVTGDEDYGDAFFSDDLGCGESIDDRHIQIDECNINFDVQALLDQLFTIADGADDLVA